MFGPRILGLINDFDRIVSTKITDDTKTQTKAEIFIKNAHVLYYEMIINQGSHSQLSFDGDAPRGGGGGLENNFLLGDIRDWDTQFLAGNNYEKETQFSVYSELREAKRLGNIASWHDGTIKIANMGAKADLTTIMGTYKDTVPLHFGAKKVDNDVLRSKPIYLIEDAMKSKGEIPVLWALNNNFAQTDGKSLYNVIAIKSTPGIYDEASSKFIPGKSGTIDFATPSMEDKKSCYDYYVKRYKFEFKDKTEPDHNFNVELRPNYPDFKNMTAVANLIIGLSCLSAYTDGEITSLNVFPTSIQVQDMLGINPSLTAYLETIMGKGSGGGPDPLSTIPSMIPKLYGDMLNLMGGGDIVSDEFVRKYNETHETSLTFDNIQPVLDAAFHTVDYAFYGMKDTVSICKIMKNIFLRDMSNYFEDFETEILGIFGAIYNHLGLPPWKPGTIVSFDSLMDFIFITTKNNFNRGQLTKYYTAKNVGALFDKLTGGHALREVNNGDRLFFSFIQSSILLYTLWIIATHCKPQSTCPCIMMDKGNPIEKCDITYPPSNDSFPQYYINFF